MRYFQGWKLKASAISAVIVLVGGSFLMLHPSGEALKAHNKVAVNAKAHVTIVSGPQTPALVVTTSAAIGASIAAASTEAGVGASRISSSYLSPTVPVQIPVQTPTAIVPPAEPVTEPEQPAPAPVKPSVITPTPVDPPIQSDPPTISKCNACGTLQLQTQSTKAIMCPMTTNMAYVCKEEAI